MNYYTEVEFDPEAAIEAALASQTDKEKEKWQKFQEEERAKLGTLDHNAIYGFNQIRIAEDALSFVEDPDQIDFEFERMAEGYALIGDYQKAVELTTNDQKRKEYQEILDAHDAIDCGCPLTEKQGGHTIQVRTPILKFAGKTLTRCSRCSRLRC